MTQSGICYVNKFVLKLEVFGRERILSFRAYFFDCFDIPWSVSFPLLRGSKFVESKHLDLDSRLRGNDKTRAIEKLWEKG